MGVAGGANAKTTDTTNFVFLMDANNVVSFVSGSTTVYNLMGGQTGSIQNGAIYDSKAGGCFAVDGTDTCGIVCDTFQGIQNCAASGSGATSAPLQNYTIELWANLASDGPIGYPCPMGAKDTAHATGGYSFNMHSSMKFFFDGFWGAGPRRHPFGTFAYTKTEWIQLVVTYDGANAYGYQNAIQAGTYTGAQTGDMKAAAEKFCIGFAGPASVEWAGEITGIKIYNKALTQAEVLQNYNDQKDRFGL